MTDLYVRAKILTPDEAKELGVWRRHVFTYCDANYRGKAFYVIKFDTGIKIGMATNLSSRLKAYQSPWIRDITHLQAYKSELPHYWERYFLDKFQKCIVGTNSREYLLGVSFDHVISIIQKEKFFQPWRRY